MSLRIAITGSSGLIGSEIVDYFTRQGHRVTRVVRLESNLKTKDHIVYWDINTHKIDQEGLEGHDAIIHLAGASIADERWTPEYKEIIYASRVQGTAFLSEAITKLEIPPKVFISASAVGYYGSIESPKTVDESSPSAEDFLAKVCVDWERATEAVKNKGTRVVNLRLGMVVSGLGGALPKMLPFFQLGLGGKLGSGKQIISWIALKEIPSVIQFLIQNNAVQGPVNCVSPYPVSNAVFTRVLGSVLNKPTILPVPGFGVNIMFGEMGHTLLLSGAHVLPRKLEENGYRFQYLKLEEVLRKCVSEVS